MRSTFRSRRRRNAQKGMTLLEIMIVLAILALVMGFVVGPRIYDAFSSSKVETQRMMNQKYASEGFLNWARKPGNKGCPTSIQEIATEMGRSDAKDNWGNELKFFCGATVPPGTTGGFAVLSFGPDSTEGSPDDILCDASGCK